MITKLIVRSHHVPPAPSFPLSSPAVQVGHSIGNLCSLRRVVTCPRRHSRQKVCPQGSRRAIESSGISSIHMPHSNNRWADMASSALCAESMRSSLSYSSCSRIASRILLSRSEGELDALEDDGVDDRRVNDNNCLGGARVVDVLWRA